MDESQEPARAREAQETTTPTHPTALESWPAQVAVAVVTGVVTTQLPVQRWPRAARWTLHGGMGALAAAGAAVVARRPDLIATEDETTEKSRPPRTPLSPAATAGVALGVGGLVAAVSRGSEGADGWMERRLAGRGVRRPRVWMGVAAAGLSLAMSVADRRREDASRHEEPDPTRS